MTCPQITQSFYIKEDATRIMVYTSIGLYFLVQNQLSIDAFKGLRMIRKHLQKSYNDTS